MLEGNLFDFVSVAKTGDGCVSQVRLHPESEIYAAHFKGMPITPGVCLVQMATESVARATGKAVRLMQAKDIKFLKPVIPSEAAELRYEISFRGDDTSDCSVKVVAGDNVYAKMSLTFATD